MASMPRSTVKNWVPLAVVSLLVGFIVITTVPKYLSGGWPWTNPPTSPHLKALLSSYKDEPPEGFQLQDGLYYNASYPGNQIAMAAPLSDGAVEYTDGSPQTVAQYSKDVAAFLMWAADPHLNTRKQTGWIALFYLLLTTVLLFVAKQRVWASIKKKS